MEQSVAAQYNKWLSWKPTTFYLTSKEREERIRQAYSTGKDADATLAGFCRWLRQNDAKIDTVVMWGSYVKGIESPHSFTRLKVNGEKQDLLAHGPSDIDALVIAKEELDPPKLMREYSIVDPNLKIIDKKRINVFQDVIVLQKQNLARQLDARKPEYRDYFICAYFHLGLVLKSSPSTKALFKQYDRPSLPADCERYFQSRFVWFRKFPKEMDVTFQKSRGKAGSLPRA